MPKTGWDPDKSSKALRHLMGQAGLSSVELAERIESAVGGQVRRSDVEAWRAGEEPPQRYTPALFDLLKLDSDPEAWSLLYPRTAAQADRDKERAATRADLAKRSAALDEDWAPPRFRG